MPRPDPHLHQLSADPANSTSEGDHLHRTAKTHPYCGYEVLLRSWRVSAVGQLLPIAVGARRCPRPQSASEARTSSSLRSVGFQRQSQKSRPQARTTSTATDTKHCHELRREAQRIPAATATHNCKITWASEKVERPKQAKKASPVLNLGSDPIAQCHVHTTHPSSRAPSRLLPLRARHLAAQESDRFPASSASVSACSPRSSRVSAGSCSVSRSLLPCVHAHCCLSCLATNFTAAVHGGRLPEQVAEEALLGLFGLRA